ncbi:Mur ligase family protein [Sphaerotilus mobilis]|uniref:UDP-N-acetylmuramoylalanine--D-glutamate ligase n=1 Tax=Sphaerotilus mobilis TaxID=47994 RepID=A0A4Q7M9H9_9BURK|nr:Mur ligase family protein [Sphaerotilus mobilis]RZS63302.1 UDP-N-acetylmuramoylalanine--D-glutamate ligase [Sphaerotilus mobilis]
MNFLRDLHVLVLGLGDSGLAMARWAQRCGAARIVVADSRDAPPQAQRLAEDVPGAELRCGPFTPALVEDGMTLVLKSPGLSPLEPAMAALIDAAEQRGLLVLGELSLYAHALADLKAARGYAPKVIAITGTNGKTTTTALTALLVERAGLRVAMAGNIGPTLLDTLGAALDAEAAAQAASPLAASTMSVEAVAQAAAEVEPVPVTLPATEPDAARVDEVDDVAEAAEAIEPAEPAEPDDIEAVDDQPETPAPVDAALPDDAPAEVIGGGPPPHLIPPPPPAPEFAHLPQAWVLELSSFQLDGVTNFEPTSATVLNITQDHLDWHGDLVAYAAAKARIFGKQAVMVLNRDDPAVLAMVPQPPPPELNKAGKPVKAKGPKWQARRTALFGLDRPRRPGDWGLVVEQGMAWLVRAHPGDPLDEATGKRAALAYDPDELSLQRLMPADALRIRGRHNAANALAALALANAAGLPLAPMLHGLREYRGEPHRVEFLRSVSGIDAYDDSKGTNVGATVAALLGLGPDKAPAKLAVILGGDGKGQDFAPLAPAVAAHARAVALIGRDAAAIEAAVADAVAASAIPMARFDTLEAATRWCFEQCRAGDAVLLSPACASLDMFRNYAHRAQVFADAVTELAEERGEYGA